MLLNAILSSFKTAWLYKNLQITCRKSVRDLKGLVELCDIQRDIQLLAKDGAID